jgi:hypothetical protein
MSKYDPLRTFLKSQAVARLPMTFVEVERILGFRLPASARNHQAWWANEMTNHVQARAWMGAGYETQQVDLSSKTIVFARVPSRRGMSDEPKTFQPAKSEGQNAFRHPAFGALKGTFTIEPGYDLTKPVYSDAEWAEIEDEMLANFDRLFPDGIK